MKLFHASPHELLIVSLAVSVIGLVVLALYTSSIMPRQIEISEILLMPLGSQVQIEGTVSEVRQGESTTTFVVCDTVSIHCVDVRAFKSVAPFAFEGEKVRAAGILKEWQGRTYLEVKKASDISVIR